MLERMNQVSVTEFMPKSKEEMYDMAVEMVEKYNRLVDICNDSAERIADLIERHKVYTSALNKDIADKAAKIELLEKEIEGRKECYTALKELMDTKYISTEEHNNICEDFKKKIAELEKELADRNTKIRHQKENLDGINKTLEIRTKENESLIVVRNNLNKEIEAHEAENARLSEKIMELKKERDRHMARVNDLQMALDCVKASEEKHEEAAHDKVVEGLRETITYWRNKYVAAQEEIDKLDGDLADMKNQTESFIKELKDENARLEKLRKKEDDHGRAGFEEYIKHIIEEEERKFKGELNKRFSEEVSKISQKRTEEELAKVKLNEKYGYAGKIAFRIRSEVDKKRIVDIGEGAEKILGVSRELFDAAIKALADDGYQEIIGRIPQATNSYVYMDMHVLATPDVETKETANAENIKSLDFDIPCGEDAIE